MAERVISRRPDLSLDGADGRPKIDVAHCPERVLPGRVMVELVTNDRIVGGLDDEAAERAKSVYETFCKGQILSTDSVTAEMAKLVENSFRDVNIAFANELSLISDRLEIDVWELIRLANHHPRVNILQPGPGVGGHCIAVDPWFIVDSDPEQARLIRTAREVNDSKPRWVVEKAKAALEGMTDPVIAALGLTFKANIDDLRESPAKEIAIRLASEIPGVQVQAVEPNLHALPEDLLELGNITLSEFDEAVSAADLVLVLVDHAEFKEASAAGYTCDGPVIDCRGVWPTGDKHALARIGGDAG